MALHQTVQKESRMAGGKSKNTSFITGQKPIAAIDIGTNSAHLAIADIDATGHLQIIDTEKVVLSLGREIDKNNHLSDAAIERTINALKHMKDIATHHTNQIRAVATYATRIARNHKKLLNAIARETGIQVEIIDGYEEARLEFLGIQQGLPLQNIQCLAADIGGGSTEIIIGQNSELFFTSSIKAGAVILTKKFFEEGRFDADSIENLEEYLENRFASVSKETKGLTYARAIASSGTAKALAGMAAKLRGVNLPSDPHGSILTDDDLRDIYKRLGKLIDPKKIKTEFDLDQNRSEIILAGAAILRELSKIFKVKEWTISTFSLREGLVIDTYTRMYGAEALHVEDVRWRNLRGFGAKHTIDQAYAEHNCRLSLEIFDGIANTVFADISAAELRELRELLRAAAYLCEIGKSVNTNKFHRHSDYMVSHSSLTGFTQREKQTIGLIIRLHRKSAISRADLRSDLADINFEAISKLAACLRLATGLNRTRRNVITGVKVSVTGGRQLRFILDYSGVEMPAAELYKIEAEKHAVEKLWDLKLEFQAVGQQAQTH